MNKLRSTIALIALLFMVQLSFSQNITLDKFWANKHLEKAKEHYKNKIYDSAAVCFEKASVLYEKHNQWQKYLLSKKKQGECLQQQWKLNQAVDIIKPTISKALLHSNESDTLIAELYYDLGLFYYYQSQSDSAVVYWKETLEITEELFGLNHLKTATVLNGLGGVFCLKSEYAKSLEYYLKSLEIKKKLLNEKHSEIAKSYNNIGLVFCYISEYDKSIEYHLKSLEIKKELYGEKHTDVTASFSNLGLVYWSKAEYDKSLDYHLKSLKINEELLGENHMLVAQTFNHIGEIYRKKNEFYKSLESHFKSLEINKKLFGENHLSTARSYNNIGILYLDKSEFDKSLQYYLQSLKVQKKLTGEKHQDVANTYNNIGELYRKKLEYDKSLEYHFKSLGLKKELFGEKHFSVAKSYTSIGLVFREKFEYDKSLSYYLKSLDIHKKLFGENHLSIAEGYKNIGVVLMNKNEYDKCLEYHLAGLRIFKELFGEKHTSIADSYKNIGVVLFNSGKYSESLEYYFKSLQIYKELFGEKHLELAILNNNIGENYIKQHEYDKALKHFHLGAASISPDFKDTVNISSTPIIKNYLLWSVLLQSLQSKAYIFANHSDKLDADLDSSGLKIALSLYMACDSLVSQTRVKMKTKSDKIALGRKGNEIYNQAINISLKLMNFTIPDSIPYYKNLAFYFSEKNKSSVLHESITGAEAQKFAGIPDSLLKIEKSLNTDVIFYKKKLAEQQNSTGEFFLKTKLFDSNRAYEELIKNLEINYPKYHKLKHDSKQASVEDIQKVLDNKTALISYFVGDSNITVFAISKKKFDVQQVKKDKNFENIIKMYLFQLKHPRKEVKPFKDLSTKLYKQLFPIKLDGKIKNLVIIPDGILNSIPFETLITQTSHAIDSMQWKNLPYLITKYNISYNYSASLWYNTHFKQTESVQKNDFLALAPIFDDGNSASVNIRTRAMLAKIDSGVTDSVQTRGMLLNGDWVSDLPATESEVKKIFTLFKRQNNSALIKTRTYANEAFVKSDTMSQYKYIHIATHGFVNKMNPELSGIILAQDSTINEDGILYFGEIYNLNLNTDLTVLSACETGSGQMKKGEGVLGLTRALMYAGSKNIIVSLWKVADNSTSNLMINFYDNMLDDRKRILSKSLRNAKLEMINNDKFSHPFYWSPFVLIGK